MEITNKLKWDYIQMRMMFLNYRMFFLEYEVKLKSPFIPDIDVIKNVNDELRDLYVQFKDMVERAHLGGEYEAYLLYKNDILKNEIFTILETIAQEYGTELNFIIPQKRSYYSYY
jgi:hypothetical protein